jgi:indole-3-glycerol phosphate synthase
VGFLSEAVEKVRRSLDRDPPNEGTLLMRIRARPQALDLAAALGGPSIPIIAEFVRASPSVGPIADRHAGERAASYEAGGASAISVLTEPRYFDGSLADLRAVRGRTTLPVLRRDIILRPSQVIQARAEGADAVVLIAAALSALEARELGEIAAELGMSSVVEVHSREDLERALGSGSGIVLVNALDMETLQVDVEGVLTLLREMPPDRIAVLEAGIATRREVEEAGAAGAHAVLVGEALMRAADPAVALRRLRGLLAPAPASDP